MEKVKGRRGKEMLEGNRILRRDRRGCGKWYETDKIGNKIGADRVKRACENADVKDIIKCNVRQRMAAEVPGMETVEVSAFLFCGTGTERTG